jgi:hypothetical protein
VINAQAGAGAPPTSWQGNSGLTVLPTLLNEFWYGYQIGGGSAVGWKAIGGGDALALDQSGYGGSSTPGWNTALFTAPYGQIGAGLTSVTVAARTGYRTPATATTQLGIRFDSSPIIDQVIATGTPAFVNSAYRYWIGMFNQVATLGNVASGADPATEYMAFRFDSALDTTWKGVVRDGVTTAVVDTGVVVTDDTEYRLTMRVENGTVIFQVNGANDVIASVNVPAASTSLWPHGQAIKDATAVGANVKWYLQRLIIRVESPTKFR